MMCNLCHELVRIQRKSRLANRWGFYFLRSVFCSLVLGDLPVASAVCHRPSDVADLLASLVCVGYASCSMYEAPGDHSQTRRPPPSPGVNSARLPIGRQSTLLTGPTIGLSTAPSMNSPLIPVPPPSSPDPLHLPCT